MGRPNIAALQVALRTQGVYHQTIDGIRGPATEAAVRRFQRRAGLTADGVVGPRTRRALGRFARRRLGARPLERGRVGADVAGLQFELAWHGFPSGAFDGVFGPETETAVRGFQRFAGLAVDGVAGPQTFTALRSRPPESPLSLAWPVRARISSLFGPRGDRFHEGLDLAASYGTPVEAAGTGTVVFAGWNDGFGKLVVVRHPRQEATYYAHLSSISVRPGERLRTGRMVGRVGATGEASGPHLHFEVRVRGAAVDPLSALG